MILGFLVVGLLIGWIRWYQQQERGTMHYALFQRNGQRWPHCTVRVAKAGIWIQHGITVWSIPWAQVTEALSGPDWWGMRLQSGDFVGIYWDGDSPLLAEWWP